MENGELELKNLKQILFFTFHFTFYIFLFGCSVKTTPVYTVIKTPNLRVSDGGFLKEGFGYKEIEIYKGGIEPFKITIKNSYICLNKDCLDKERFVKKYLSDDYEKNILDLIIERKPIKNCGKITFIKNGFIQKNDRFFYKVEADKVIFKDRKKGIVIFVKELKERG
jgi:hypothetical protein